MNKSEFLKEVAERLQGLPQEDTDRALDYFSEMIDEHIEDGATEEEAVTYIGSVDAAVSSVIGDIPLPKIIKTKVKTDRELKTWELILLIAGSPLWIALIITALALFLALYIVIWALAIVAYAVTLALGVASIASVAAGIGAIFSGYSAYGFASVAAGLICGGLSILFFHLSTLIAKGTLKLSKKIILSIKLCFIRKKENENE